MKILLVEDDPHIAKIVHDGLTSASHMVETATDGSDGSFLARSFNYDAIILDNSLPKKSGMTVCSEIRASGKTTPIIFLSVTDDAATKVAAFDSGADDYVVKPFSLQELSARLRAIARRPQTLVSKTLRVADLDVDIEKHQVIRDSHPIHLTRKEFNLLEYLMRNPGIIHSRAALLEHVWTADTDVFSNTVEAHMRNLRKKISLGHTKPDLIANITGRGYVINTPEQLKKI